MIEFRRTTAELSTEKNPLSAFIQDMINTVQSIADPMRPYLKAIECNDQKYLKKLLSEATIIDNIVKACDFAIENHYNNSLSVLTSSPYNSLPNEPLLREIIVSREMKSAVDHDNTESLDILLTNRECRINHIEDTMRYAIEHVKMCSLEKLLDHLQNPAADAQETTNHLIAGAFIHAAKNNLTDSLQLILDHDAFSGQVIGNVLKKYSHPNHLITDEELGLLSKLTTCDKYTDYQESQAAQTGFSLVGNHH